MFWRCTVAQKQLLSILKLTVLTCTLYFTKAQIDLHFEMQGFAALGQSSYIFPPLALILRTFSCGVSKKTLVVGLGMCGERETDCWLQILLLHYVVIQESPARGPSGSPRPQGRPSPANVPSASPIASVKKPDPTIKSMHYSLKNTVCMQSNLVKTRCLDEADANVVDNIEHAFGQFDAELSVIEIILNFNSSCHQKYWQVYYWGLI